MVVLRVGVDGGELAVEVVGDGPLVLCVPGMGESIASFRHLVPLLIDAGYRVAVMDLRGHGASSTDFPSCDDEAAASDVVTVLEELGGPVAAVIGNSMGAAAAVLASRARPELIGRLVLIGPFVRDHGSPASRFLLRMMLARPWGPAAWASYYRSLFGEVRPDDHDAHVTRSLELLRRPGRWRAFQRTARTSHAAAEAALPGLAAAVLVVMGDRDRDFPDPESEAAWVAEATNGQYWMVEGAGHYPMGERPESVFQQIHGFLDRGDSRG